MNALEQPMEFGVHYHTHRGRPSRAHSRNNKRRQSRSPLRSKGKQSRRNKGRSHQNGQQNGKKNQRGQQQQNRRRVYGKKKNEKRGSSKSERRRVDPVCSSCKRKKCRCRCTRCECSHHYRGCGKLFKDCQCETRQFGSYKCSNCDNRWSSGYTFVRGRGRNGKALYGQQCKRCNDRRHHKAYQWRELEAMECPVCREKPCNKNPPCMKKQPHQQALCKRCKNKAVPCSSRY